MSFKQRKPRTAATRQKDTTEDDDGDDLGSGISPMAAAQARKKREGKKKVGTAGAALSFADEVSFVGGGSRARELMIFRETKHRRSFRGNLPSRKASTFKNSPTRIRHGIPYRRQ